jgi:hypothetical protein
VNFISASSSRTLNDSPAMLTSLLFKLIFIFFSLTLPTRLRRWRAPCRP